MKLFEITYFSIIFVNLFESNLLLIMQILLSLPSLSMISSSIVAPRKENNTQTMKQPHSLKSSTDPDCSNEQMNSDEHSWQSKFQTAEPNLLKFAVRSKIIYYERHSKPLKVPRRRYLL